MIKLIQSQSTMLHSTYMKVEGGANCHDFCYKHLFYVLSIRPTSFHVSGGATLSDSGMGLVTVMFSGSTTIHSLNPSYWNPTDHTYTLFLSDLKLYGGFQGASHESLSPCTFCDSQGNNFLVKKMIKMKSWLHQPSGCQEWSNTTFSTMPPSFTKNNKNET